MNHVVVAAVAVVAMMLACGVSLAAGQTAYPVAKGVSVRREVPTPKDTIPMHQSMHSPVSIELSDGRIMAVFLYHYDAPWNEGSFGSSVLGITSAVFWRP